MVMSATRGHTVDKGPSWNLNSGLPDSKLMVMNMDSGTGSGSNSSSISCWLCVLGQGAWPLCASSRKWSS